jgi:hypothetical protein
VVGAALTTDRFGNPNRAYDFDGNSKITIPNSTTFNVDSEMTISLWFKKNTSGNTINYILQKGTGGGCAVYGYYIGIDYNFGLIPNGAKMLSYGNNNNCATIGSDTALNSSWTSMILIYSPLKGNKLYFDGVLSSANFSYCASCTITNSNEPLIIGGYNDAGPITGPSNWNGQLDDIGLWNRALTQLEVIALYTSISTGIDDLKTSNIKIYPNPTNHIINIDGVINNENTTAKIFDVQGKLILSKELIEKGTIDISDLNNGVYVIKIGEMVQRIVKM